MKLDGRTVAEQVERQTLTLAAYTDLAHDLTQGGLHPAVADSVATDVVYEFRAQFEALKRRMARFAETRVYVVEGTDCKPWDRTLLRKVGG